MTLTLPLNRNHFKQRLKSILGFTSEPKINRKIVKKYHITALILASNTLALLMMGDFHRAASAAPLFDKFTTYVKTGITTFFAGAGGAGGAGGAAIGTALTALVSLIPWAIILLVGAIAGWQAYLGYQAYEREDLSGMGKCVLNVVVLVGLTFTASLVTDSFVA
jgi:hypothetical protein